MKNKRGLKSHIESNMRWNPRKKEIKWLYHECKWSLEKVGKYFGVSQTAMSKAIKRMGISSRGKGRLGKENGRYIDGSQSRLYRQMIEKDKCSHCGLTTDLVVHHKNGDHQDNHLENLKILCGSCHSSYHKKLWWEKNKERRKNIKRNPDGTFT